MPSCCKVSPRVANSLWQPLCGDRGLLIGVGTRHPAEIRDDGDILVEEGHLGEAARCPT